MRTREGGSARARVLLVWIFAFVMPLGLFAQLPDSVVAARTKAVAMQLRCPVCQGLSLQESQSELAAQMKGLIHEQVAAGQSEEQVKAYFVTKYGEWILLAPPAHGFNLAVYILPFLMLFGGMGVLYISVRRWTKSEQEVDTEDQDNTPEPPRRNKKTVQYS